MRKVTGLLENKITLDGLCGPQECSLKLWQIIKRVHSEMIKITRANSLHRACGQLVDTQIILEKFYYGLDSMFLLQQFSKDGNTWQFSHLFLYIFSLQN